MAVKLKTEALAITRLPEIQVMGKVMVSLSDEAEQLVRQEVDKLYYGRSGGFSIFFEHLVRKILQRPYPNPLRQTPPIIGRPSDKSINIEQ
jgi:hypothetical protein